MKSEIFFLIFTKIKHLSHKYERFAKRIKPLHAHSVLLGTHWWLGQIEGTTKLKGGKREWFWALNKVESLHTSLLKFQFYLIPHFAHIAMNLLSLFRCGWNPCLKVGYIFGAPCNANFIIMLYHRRYWKVFPIMFTHVWWNAYVKMLKWNLRKSLRWKAYDEDMR